MNPRDAFIFGMRGPQVVGDEYGREPSLREMVERYYLSNGCDAEQAESYATDYIFAWLADYNEAKAAA